MNRRDFLVKLGLGATACALSPLLDLAPIEAAPSVAIYSLQPWGILAIDNDGTYHDHYFGIDRSAYGPMFLRMENVSVVDGMIQKVRA